MAVTGRIHKGIGGFYYVETADGLYECKARGAFRKQRITPLVGDRVEITVNAQGENTIDTILPRKNELRRPPLANLDRLFIVSSLVDPEIRTVQIDKLTVLAAQKGIDCVIVLTKADLAENGQQYAAANSMSRSLAAALSASASPASVNGEFDHPWSLLYRLKNVCP